MPISRSDILALLIALGAIVASLVVWDYGKVDVGLTVERDTHGLTDPPGLVVSDVTPDGNAARSWFSPMAQVIRLTSTGGGEVAQSEPIDATLEGPYPIYQAPPWGPFVGVAQEIRTYEGDFTVPVEPVDSANIETIAVGSVDLESNWISVFGVLDRAALEGRLRDLIALVALGIALGVGIWRFLAHGFAGEVGRQRAVLIGVSAGLPFLLAPVVQVGTPAGIWAGYVVPIAAALLVGLSLSWSSSDRSWRQTGVTAALVAAGLAVVFVARYMTSHALNPDERGAILILVAAIAVVPAAISSREPRRFRDRAGAVSLGVVPAAALTLFTQQIPDPVLPLGLLAVALGWQLLPVERAFAVARGSVAQLRAPRVSVERVEPVLATWRDRLTYALLGLVIFAGITQYNTWAVVIGVGLAGAVGLAVRRGFLGDEWTDAAVPLAAAVGIPVIQLAFEFAEFSAVNLTIITPVALAAVSVAHLLATRHSDPDLRVRLFGGSVALFGVAMVLSMAGFSPALLLVGLIPLIPGFPVAFAEDSGESRALRSRLETLVVALTPGAAATVLVAGTNGVLLGGWLLAVVVWRQFTLNPLMGLAQRTQLQRDLAVAAAETERARLAADLHDDALQQLTMLVRTLDESGNKAAADQAREVATKLRSVVGDLRLPILDDLGAGAALEWLVERVEPLAGGPVKLERSDETRPPANVELAVFRVAQEALTNAIKHGRPPIAVRYDVRNDGRVTLAIDDAGEGIGSEAADEAPREGHFGLANMQQRAEQIGALLDVRRWPAGGTRVALEWRPQ